jgi:glutathione S-transferase
MTIILYDLAGADPDRRFSPFCWRTRMAIAHKGLAVEAVAWRFTEKDAIAFSGQGKVPVIVDNGKTVIDSWVIADYLDEKYSQKPLLATPGERALAHFVSAWCDAVVHPAIGRIVVADIPRHLAEKDKGYFRKSREERYGMKLEDVSAGREEKISAFRQTIQPMRATVEAQPYLGGTSPNYADYVVFGAFQWARCISTAKLLAADDPVAAWRRRMLEAFDGLAGKAPAEDV